MRIYVIRQNPRSQLKPRLERGSCDPYSFREQKADNFRSALGGRNLTGFLEPVSGAWTVR